MSSEIDWSKAPEGATHFNVSNLMFYRATGPNLEYWNSTVSKWKEAQGRIEEYASIVPRYANWNGASLPPVGTVCEVDYCEQWHQCEIIANFQQRAGMVAAFTVDMGDGAKALDAFGSEYFRPIRTPEQIAAEERERAVAEMKRIWTEAENSQFYALYDAGYRKTEGGK